MTVRPLIVQAQLNKNIILIPVLCILYYLQFDQRLHNYIKQNNYE